jgi:hypothetical protein
LIPKRSTTSRAEGLANFDRAAEQKNALALFTAYAEKALAEWRPTAEQYHLPLAATRRGLPKQLSLQAL